MKNSTKREIQIVVFFGLFIGLALSLIPNHFLVYEVTAYPIDIIRSELKLSLETHGIEERVKYIDRTLDLLAPYHGNSEWWFPTERTNIDLTKELIGDISKDVHNQLGVKEREHYFFIPHNELISYLNSETSNINSRLISYGHSDYWNINNNLYWYIAGPLSFAMLMAFCVRTGIEVDD